ncbi:MAG: polymer-forming cytoskeletal protein [Pseudomonadota bacterium]
MFSKAKTTNNKTDGSEAMSARAEISAAAPAQQPSKRASVKPSGVPSIISADVVMRGNINSSGEIQFDGSLEGDVKAGSLIIGEKASVKGEVICETVIVRGRVEGAIRAKSVALAASAHIQGDILHSSLSVETGAHFEGNCRHSDDPLSDSSAKDFRRSRASAPQAPQPVVSANEETEAAPKPAVAAGGAAPSFLSQGGRSPLR